VRGPRACACDSDSVLGFLQAPFSRCYKWETWAPKILHLLGTGTRCAADYAATKNLRAHQLRREARALDGSRSSCKESSARTKPASWPRQSRRVPPIILPVAVRIRIESAHSLEITYRMGDNRRWQLWSGGRRLRKRYNNGSDCLSSYTGHRAASVLLPSTFHARADLASESFLSYRN
jgi:hypothetical protein